MTTAMRLTGPWEGLRAYPRGFRTPDSRQRMEAALERLQHHRERFDRHINRAQTAIERIDRLCDDALARLDASDSDADLEPNGDLEPSLSFTGHINQDLAIEGEPLGWTMEPDEIDLEDACEDEAVDTDSEPSLTAMDKHGGNQCGGRWIGGGASDDREDDADGDEESEVGQ